MKDIFTPKTAKITIQWVDKDGASHEQEFNESTIENAETLIGLMTGNICLEDLKP